MEFPSGAVQNTGDRSRMNIRWGRGLPWVGSSAFCRPALLFVALLSGLGGCQGDREELAEIRETQSQVLERLAELETRQGEGGRVGLSRRGQADAKRIHAIEVGDAPVLGNPGAPVTIVAFADFQCPFCARSAPLLRQVLDGYEGRVRLVYKHFPLSFHPVARQAAVASLAAQDQGAFWEMHDLLFEHPEELSASRFPELARLAGLDVERFSRDLEQSHEKYEERIDADYTQGLHADVRGTPTLFVNGRRVQVRTLQEISRMVDEELSRASSS